MLLVVRPVQVVEQLCVQGRCSQRERQMVLQMRGVSRGIEVGDLDGQGRENVAREGETVRVEQLDWLQGV